MIFVVGRTYTTRSVADHDCLISISVVSRTPKTIKALVRGEEKTLRIKVYDGVETVKPWGTFSMAPVIRASCKD